MLNKGQELAVEAFLKFLSSDTPEIIISGAAGTGKTYLMKHLVDIATNQLGKTISVTATTNKAAEVLSTLSGYETKTIHSFLNLKVVDDYSSGISKLSKTNQYTIHSDLILFIDEYSYIDTSLLKIIRESLINCKVVYLGDKNQLNPVFESTTPLIDLPIIELTQPMRNSTKKGLVTLCNQLRSTVETGIFNPIHTNIDVEWYSLEDVSPIIEDAVTKENIKFLTYSNKAAIETAEYIRHIKKQATMYEIGETLVCNTFYQVNSKEVLPTEHSFTIESVVNLPDYKIKGISIPVILLNGKITVPVNSEQLSIVLKHFIKAKDWKSYYAVKNYFADVRSNYSCTIHKSQGSTYDTVYIDLDDISQCKRSDISARLLYVAVSRAKSKIVFYGNLTKRFGGIVCQLP